MKERNKKIQYNQNNIFQASGIADKLFSTEPSKLVSMQKIINEKKFRVSNSPLSYRQTNHLENTGVIKNTRKNTKQWRKFSLKELAFFLVVKELRKYGLREEQLRNLRDVFFSRVNKKWSDFAIISAFANFQINLIVDNKGKATFYDDFSLNLFLGKNYTSYLQINLNEIMNEILASSKKKRVDYKNYQDIMSEIIDDLYLSDKELKIMEIIKNKDYKSIAIRKKGNDKFIIKAEKIDKVEEDKALDIIKGKDYSDMKIIKRNGKIEHIKIENLYKI